MNLTYTPEIVDALRIILDCEKGQLEQIQSLINIKILHLYDVESSAQTSKMEVKTIDQFIAEMDFKIELIENIKALARGQKVSALR